MIVDTTCTLANIRHSQDVSLLHDPADGKNLCTYRKRTRKDYLKYARCCKHTAKLTRKAIGKQLAYLRR